MDPKILVGEDLKDWRKSIGSDRKKGWQRASATKRPRTGLNQAERISENEAAVKVNEFTPLSPEETYRRMVNMLIENLLSNPERVKKMVVTLRKWYPEQLASLSDEEVLDWVKADTKERLKGIVDEVYHRTGRAHELTIKTEGV